MKTKLKWKDKILTIIAILIYSVLVFVILFFVQNNTSNRKALFFSTLVFIILLIGILAGIYKIWSKRCHQIMKEIYTDPITESSNFEKFKIDVQKLFEKYPQDKFVLFYSDIKNFKYINDVYGFEMGNKILRYYSDILKQDKNKIALARMNADKFVSIERYTDKNNIVEECTKRIENVSDISSFLEGCPAITVFVGAYCVEEKDKLSIDDMIDRANIAQRQIKVQQKAGCLLYTEDLRADMIWQQSLENRMRMALKNGEFVVFLQPKFNIMTNKVAAAEALVRWKDPVNGLIPPMQFIPLFERNGFIQQLDTYMFKQVCKLLHKWIKQEKEVLPISVNVSKVQLDNPAFLSDYIAIKEEYQIPDGLIEIEFTESMLFDNSQRMMQVLKFFKLHGFRSSIDDFGAGYSSLNLLKNLPADILKLDKMFFDKNEYEDREKVIIKNVISMAKELSMQTVAEGVEQMEQVEFLKEVNCELVQGYVFDKPLPVEEFERKYI